MEVGGKAVDDWKKFFSMGDLDNLLLMMEETWPGLFLHCANVANLSLKICKWLQLDQVNREELLTGALLHDVGKMLIDRSIIYKPGPLTAKEWLKVKEHPKRGAFLVAERGGKGDVLDMIRYHHERWDGLGYEGLKTNQTPLSARVIALADALDAMISPRAYHLPLKIGEALEEVYQEAGLQFDPDLVNALAKKPFWQITTYCDLNSLRRQIDEEKKWLVQLADFYATLTHPLVHAQSRWLDRLVIIFLQLRYVGRS